MWERMCAAMGGDVFVSRDTFPHRGTKASPTFITLTTSADFREIARQLLLVVGRGAG